MDYMSYKEALEKMRKSGLKSIEIYRLNRYRRNFTPGEMDEAPTDRRRLEFIRWLVNIGKLTDRL